MFQFRFDFLAHWPLTEPAPLFANQIFIFDEHFSLELFDQFESIVTMIFSFEEALFNSEHFVSESRLKMVIKRLSFRSLIYLMYLMFAFAIRGAGTKSDFMHDRSPVINFLFRFNLLLIFARLVSFSSAFSLDGDNADSRLFSGESAERARNS